MVTSYFSPKGSVALFGDLKEVKLHGKLKLHGEVKLHGDEIRDIS